MSRPEDTFVPWTDQCRLLPMTSTRPLWRSHWAWWLSLGLCACQPSEDPHKVMETHDAAVAFDASAPSEAAAEAALPEAGPTLPLDAALDAAIPVEAAAPD